MLSDLRQFYTPETIAWALSPLALLLIGFVSLLVNFSRYLLWSSILYWMFYVRKDPNGQREKFQRALPDRRQIENEIRWSLKSCVVFSGLSVLVYYCALRGWSSVYLNVSDHGWPYLFTSIGIMLILHDVYFYLTHLASHRIGFIFRKFHRIHHQSGNPTPFADIMFHPVDAVIHFGFIPLFLFTLPVHPIAIGLFVTLVLVINSLGHIGFEMFPRFFSHPVIMPWVNRANLHNIHHSHVHYNFGLYFRFLDKLFKTEKQPEPIRFAVERDQKRSAS
jgi:lathosterol oxidase